VDVHPSRKPDVIEESGLHTNQEIRFQWFVDCFGNLIRRLIGDRALGAEAGRRDWRQRIA
jgi:hypothetical protein